MPQASEESAAKKDVWEERWEGLDKTLDQLAELLGAQEASEPHPRGTLSELIRGLKRVGFKHFDHFHSGFFKNKTFKPTKDGNEKVILSPEYAMRRVVDRIAYDVDAIQAALLQREVGNEQAAANGVVNLTLTDRLAYDALALARAKGLLDEPDPDKVTTSVLTYFSDAIYTRVIPYATVSFVSVPMSSLKSPRDLLAIPHEVGHYVYWNGETKTRGPGELVATYLRRPERPGRLTTIRRQWNEALILNWVEELFADIYGCLVAGAVMALDFQDLLLQFAKDDFDSAANNDDHPTPILRPFIYTHILRKAGLSEGPGGVLWQMANKLDKRWWQLLRARGYEGIPARALPLENEGIILTAPTDEDTASPIDTIAQIGGPLEATIDEIMDKFLGFDLQTWPSAAPDWRTAYQKIIDSSEEDALERLYDDFRGALTVPEPSVGALEAGEKARIPRGRQVDKLRYPGGHWLNDLKAGNWATKGPHSLMDPPGQ